MGTAAWREARDAEAEQDFDEAGTGSSAAAADSSSWDRGFLGLYANDNERTTRESIPGYRSGADLSGRSQGGAERMEGCKLCRDFLGSEFHPEVYRQDADADGETGMEGETDRGDGCGVFGRGDGFLYGWAEPCVVPGWSE
jgi:hypothetical protein